MQTLTQLREMQNVLKVQLELINGNEAAMQCSIGVLMDFVGDLSQCASAMDVVNVYGKHGYILARVYIHVDLDGAGELMVSVKNCDGYYALEASSDMYRVCEAIRSLIDDLRG